MKVETVCIMEFAVPEFRDAAVTLEESWLQSIGVKRQMIWRGHLKRVKRIIPVRASTRFS